MFVFTHTGLQTAIYYYPHVCWEHCSLFSYFPFEDIICTNTDVCSWRNPVYIWKIDRLSTAQNGCESIYNVGFENTLPSITVPGLPEIRWNNWLTDFLMQNFEQNNFSCGCLQEGVDIWIRWRITSFTECREAGWIGLCQISAGMLWPLVR